MKIYVLIELKLTQFRLIENYFPTAFKAKKDAEKKMEELNAESPDRDWRHNYEIKEFDLEK
jgi:hypothetical protein